MSTNSNSSTPININNMWQQVIPQGELEIYHIDEPKTYKIIRCIFVTAFQYNATGFNKQPQYKLNTTMYNKLKQFYNCIKILKQIIRNGVMQERHIKINISKEVEARFKDILLRISDLTYDLAIQYEGDEEDDPTADDMPIHLTFNFLRDIVADVNSKKQELKWLHETLPSKFTRKVRTGIRSLQKSRHKLSKPIAKVFEDPYLSSYISNMAITEKPLSRQKQEAVDRKMLQTLSHLQ